MKKITITFLFLAIASIVEAREINDSIPTQFIKEIEVSTLAKPSTTLSSSPTQVLSISEIHKLGIQSVSDAIRRFTGIVVKDYGGIGGFKAIAIRGNGAEHTSISYDGITISNAQSGQIDIGQFSLDNVSMLSLNIGRNDNIFMPASSIASVGNLNIETKRPSFMDKKSLTQIQLKTGSWGYFSPYIYYAQKLSNKFSISADANWQRSDGQYSFEIKNGKSNVKGKRYNTDVDMKRSEINLFGILNKKQSLDVKLYYFDSERGLPGAVILQGTGILKNKEEEKLWDRNFFTQAQYINKLNRNFNLRLQGKYSHSYTKYTSYDEKYPDGLQESRYNQNEYYLTGTLLYNLSQVISFSLAEDFNYNTLKANYTGFASPERYALRSALSGKYENKRLTMVGSLLNTFITENVRIGNIPEDRNRLSPTLSISFQPISSSNLRLRAYYKDIFRVPTFNDLYYARMGNTSLKPEKARQLNVGLTWNKSFSELFNYFTITTDFFNNRIKDKIVVYASSYMPKMVNLGNIKITGTSIASNLSINPFPNISIELSANYTYQKAIDISNKEDKNYKDQIPFSPKHSGSASVSIENPCINFGYSYLGSSKSYVDLQNIARNEMDGYNDHSLSFNKSFNINTFQIRLQADITNLTNRTYYIIQNFPMPRRSYRLSMNINF